MTTDERAVDDRLVWTRGMVEGRRVVYGIAGSGAPVLFLHGWALGHHAYKRALRRLARRGRQVLAPAMPGFGGTADLPTKRRTIAGYAEWVASFMDELDVGNRAIVIGHSFGGGVAIMLAHDHPERVGQLVLVNSVGGGRGGDEASRGRHRDPRVGVRSSVWRAWHGRDTLTGQPHVAAGESRRVRRGDGQCVGTKGGRHHEPDR